MNQPRIYTPDAAIMSRTNETELPQSKPFPLHCLPKSVASMGEAICNAERTPESLAGCCLLGAVSAAVGAGLQIKSGPARFARGNLFIMASGESGSGKSQVYRHAVQPVHDFENEVVEAFRRDKLPSLLAEKEMLETEIAALKKKNVSGPVERQETREQIEHKRRVMLEIENQLQPPILTVEDITSEALVVGFAAHHECLTSFSADAGEITNNLLGRYNKLDRTDDGIYVKAWSGDQFKQDRIGRPPVILRQPWLSALWLVQWDKVETILSDRTLTEGGAIPRLLLCHTNCQPRHIRDDNTGIPENVAADYDALIRVLLRTFRLAPAPVTIEPNPEALSAMNRHYNGIVDRWYSGEKRQHLCRALLQGGLEKRPPTREQLTAYGQASLRMAEGIFVLLERHKALIFASAVPRGTAKPVAGDPPPPDILRKDHIFLLERFFYFLERERQMGLLVMDEVEKQEDRRFVRRLQDYFVKTANGRERARWIVPSPFFVSSDMALPVQVADVVIYALNWGYRHPANMKTAPTRPEIESRFGAQIQKLNWKGEGFDGVHTYKTFGIFCVPDLYIPRT